MRFNVAPPFKHIMCVKYTLNYSDNKFWNMLHFKLDIGDPLVEYNINGKCVTMQQVFTEQEKILT